MVVKIEGLAIIYLIGFAVIQLVISMAAWRLGLLRFNCDLAKGLLKLRFIGFAISGVGAILLSSTVLG